MSNRKSYNPLRHSRARGCVAISTGEGKRYIKSPGPVNKSTAKDKDRQSRVKVAAGEYVKKKDNPTFKKAIEEHLKKSDYRDFERQMLTFRHYEKDFLIRKDKRSLELFSKNISGFLKDVSSLPSELLLPLLPQPATKRSVTNSAARVGAFIVFWSY